jgi:hypothetical protein
MGTDMMKLIVALRNFANATNKKHTSEVHVRSTGKCFFTANGFR